MLIGNSFSKNKFWDFSLEKWRKLDNNRIVIWGVLGSVANGLKFNSEICNNKLYHCAKFQFSTSICLLSKKLPIHQHLRIAYRILKKFAVFLPIIYSHQTEESLFWFIPYQINNCFCRSNPNGLLLLSDLT